MEAGTRTQVILVQLNFVHERRHHKGESLPVEVVKSVADEHGQEDGRPVVSIARCGHGCRRPLTRSHKSARRSLICDLCFGVCTCSLTGAGGGDSTSASASTRERPHHRLSVIDHALPRRR